jgi:hypothetical protein
MSRRSRSSTAPIEDISRRPLLLVTFRKQLRRQHPLQHEPFDEGVNHADEMILWHRQVVAVGQRLESKASQIDSQPCVMSPCSWRLPVGPGARVSITSRVREPAL